MDRVIRWLTGYDQAALERQLAAETDFETFFAQAPAMNPKRLLIKGVICGVRIEEIEDPLMKEIRYLDKRQTCGRPGQGEVAGENPSGMICGVSGQEAVRFGSNSQSARCPFD